MTTATKKKSKKAWSKSFGEYGNRIRIFEDPSSRIIYAESRDETNPCGYRSRSLRHRDRTRAEQWGKEQAARLAAGDESLRNPTPTVSRILSLYLTHQTPKKCPSEQQADERRAMMWTRVLGPKKDLSKLMLREWNQFIEFRGTGVINPEGNPVLEEKRKPVRPGTIAADLIFMKTVLNWSCRWQDMEARYLMKENPARGFELPKDKNPRRPVATADRFEKLRAVAGQVMMVVGRGETRRETPSYLTELLDLANGTGRRIFAILALKYQDLQLDCGPDGSIRWPADTDKTGKESLVPINEDVRAAINHVLRERPGLGAAFLFPSPQNSEKHVSKELASAWLQRAEKLAAVPTQEGGLWHPYRRKWVIERKHWPDVDVAAAGGWSDPVTVRAIYQQADPDTMFKVVSEPVKLREA